MDDNGVWLTFPNSDGLAGMSAIALDTLAVEIRQEAEAAEADFQSAVVHAIRAGELLIEAKSQVAHGAWIPWLAENFEFTRQTASGYMRLATHADQLEGAPSISAALKQIAPPIDEPTPEPTPDRCSRCGSIVRATHPHECPEAIRQLSDAQEALTRAYKDVARYPRASHVDLGKCVALARACGSLADQIRDELGGRDGV